MKTVEEVADNIMFFVSKHSLHVDHCHCFIEVAKEVSAYAEERVKVAEAKEAIMHGMMVAAFDQRDKARAEALEEAAKVVDHMLEFKIDKTNDTLHGPIVSSEIRALKAKPMGENK